MSPPYSGVKEAKKIELESGVSDIVLWNISGLLLICMALQPRKSYCSNV
jgi:hypothetical protein